MMGKRVSYKEEKRLEEISDTIELNKIQSLRGTQWKTKNVMIVWDRNNREYPVGFLEKNEKFALINLSKRDNHYHNTCYDTIATIMTKFGQREIRSFKKGHDFVEFLKENCKSI